MKFERIIRGRRYWCGQVVYNPFTKTSTWTFWSDHDGPFYHGHYTQEQYNPEEAYQAFCDWIPYRRGEDAETPG